MVEGGGYSKDTDELAPPLFNFLSPSLRFLAGSGCHGSTHIAAGWLERGALVEKEREEEKKGETDHCRGRGGMVPPPLTSYHWHQQRRAAERPRCCSVVHTRQIQTSDCIYYSSCFPCAADSRAAVRHPQKHMCRPTHVRLM